MRDSKLFDEAIKVFFEPLAQKHSLPFSKTQNGVYEISSQHFIMRIRLDTGHRRGLNVLLRPASLKKFDENVPGVEYGIGNFLLFAGADWKDSLIENDTDFLDLAERLAKASECFILPYLLGIGKDFEAIKKMVNKRTENKIKQIKTYRFPKNVHKKWI